MKTITVITPANIEVEYKLAGVGARLAALIIDSLIQFAAVLLCIGILFGVNRQLTNLGIAPRPSTIIAALIIIAFIIYMGYFITCEMLMNGQTVGKRLFGLRVIRDNGQPIEFTQALIRGIIRTTLDMMYIGLFVIMFSKKHKRIGDMAAGTIVVIEKYDVDFFNPVFAAQYMNFSGFLQPTINQSASDTNQLNFNLPEFLPPFMDMTVEERSIVEDWLRRRETLSDYGAGIGEKLAEYFETKSKTPAAD